jgi:Zn-dependent protease with chaperone function
MGLLKVIGKAAYGITYRYILSTLRYCHYSSALQLFCSMSNAMCLQESAKPLQCIQNINSSFKDIAPQIIALTKKLSLRPESIQVFVSTKKMPLPTSTTKTFDGHMLILNDKDLTNSTPQEMRAAITHELVHMKDNYALKALCTAIVTPLILDITTSIICPKYKVSNEHSLLMNAGLASCYNIATSLVMRTLGRHFEKHADILAAETDKCAQNLIDFLKKHQKRYQQSKGSGPLSKLYTFSEIFDTHPTYDERYQYLVPYSKKSIINLRFS